MKKAVLALFLMAALTTLFGWSVGEPIGQDYSWTDSNGEQHSIYELVDDGKAVVLFWGGFG